MAVSAHKIGRIKFVIDCPDRRIGNKVMEQVSQQYKSSLEKELEKIMDVNDPDSSMNHRFQKVVLNLGTTSLRNLNYILREKLPKKLGAWLQRHINTPQERIKLSPEEMTSQEAQRRRRVMIDKNIEILNRKQHEGKLLRQVLVDGFFHGGYARDEDSIQEILKHWILKRPKELRTRVLQGRLDDKIIKRLRSLVDSETFTRWFSGEIQDKVEENISARWFHDLITDRPVRFRAIHTELTRLRQVMKEAQKRVAERKDGQAESSKLALDAQLEQLILSDTELRKQIRALRESITRVFKKTSGTSAAMKTLAEDIVKDVWQSIGKDLTDAREDKSQSKNQKEDLRIKYFKDADRGLSGHEIFPLIQMIFTQLELGKKSIDDYLNDPLIDAKLKAVLPLLAQTPPPITPRQREMRVLIELLQHGREPWWWVPEESDIPALQKQELREKDVKTIMHHMVSYVPFFADRFIEELKRLSEAARLQVLKNLSKWAYKKSLFEIYKVLKNKSLYSLRKHLRERRQAMKSVSSVSDHSAEVYYQELKTLTDGPVQQSMDRHLFDESPELFFLETGMSLGPLERKSLQNYFTEKPHLFQQQLAQLSPAEFLKRDVSWVNEALFSELVKNNNINLWTDFQRDMRQLREILSYRYSDFLRKLEVYEVLQLQNKSYGSENFIDDFIAFVDSSLRAKNILQELFRHEVTSSFNLSYPFVMKLRSEIQKSNILQKHSELFPSDDERNRTYKKLWDSYGDLQEIPIKNAGMVIIWPFITTLFTKLGYLNPDGQFLNREVQSKAVVLLHYICTNSLLYEEHHLVLNKIFCGFPIDEAIEPGFVITEDEKRIAGKLLGAVVNQWSALKNTSINALRGSFLLRNGVLSNRDHSAWDLKVERKPYDVLIGKMPWGFSMIRFRWTIYTIKVDWNYHIQ